MSSSQDIAGLKSRLKLALDGDDALEARNALRSFLQAGPGTTGVQMAANRLPDFATRVGLSTYRIALLTSFTADPLEPHLALTEFLSQRSLSLLNIPYQQWQLALADTSALDDFAPDVVIVLLHLEDVLPLLARRHLASADGLEAESDGFLGALRSSLGSYRQRFAKPIVLSTLIAARRGVERHFDRRISPSRAAHIEALNLGLSEIAADINNTYVFDYAATVADFGRVRWFDPVGHHHTHCSVSSAALPELAGELSGFLDALNGPRDKVLALDLDNTLWHGVIGEDGIDGIAQSGGWPGNAYRDFQAFAINLRASGIALAVVSKNNETDAREVFDSNPNMPIGWDDFAARKINWLSKADNLVELSQELSLGLDRFVFADDNPLEIDMTREQLPEVHSVHLDGSASHFPEAILKTGSFYAVSLTEEDRSRAESYRAQSQRGIQQRKTASLDEFLVGLNLQLELRIPRPTEFERVAQLCARTNQFNLTAIRYDVAQILELVRDDHANLMIARLSDNYGDYGLIGVIVTRDRTDVGSRDIENFLMSCRVLGRKVENAIIADAERTARSDGFSQLIGCFATTSKNAVAANFYRENGFVDRGEDGRFVRDLPRCKPLSIPKWINLNKGGVGSHDTR